jgi:hypothetical protein
MIWDEEDCWQQIIRNRRRFRMSNKLSTALVELKRDEVVEMVRSRIRDWSPGLPSSPRGGLNPYDWTGWVRRIWQDSIVSSGIERDSSN